MGNRSAKSRERDDEDEVGSDRISQLPDSVIHHILCFMSQKKAVQTCVLSKSWRHLGPTRPVIDLRGACDLYHAGRNKFCQNCFCGNSEALLSTVDNTFQRYYDQNLSAQEIRLEMLCIDRRSISVLEKWIPIFVKPNSCVTTFHLSFNYYKFVAPHDWPRLDLPSSVFKAESLENLYLSDSCRISSLENVVLTNLRKLSLSFVEIDDESLEKILSGCPSLEYAEISYCKGLKSISVAKNENRYLKEFKFFGFYERKIQLDVIEIDGPSLQSIYIQKCMNWKLNRNNCFPHLKSLDLCFVKLSTEWFENFSRNFPLLEEFKLHRCHGFDEIKLFSPSLKHLTLRLDSSIKVNVDAPNLLCFTFYGCYLPTTTTFATASREWKSKITWENEEFGYVDDLPRFGELKEMLKGVSQSEISLKIAGCVFYESMQMECGVHDPVAVENLDISDIVSNSNFDSIPCLFYALFQVCRPRYITTWHDLWSSGDNNRSHGKQTIAEGIPKIFIHGGEKHEYYWLENLKEVSVEASDFGGKVWHHVERTCFPKPFKNQKISFRLKWRD